MRSDDDGKAEARATEVAGSGVVGSGEPVEDTFPVGRVDAAAVVVDVEHDDCGPCSWTVIATVLLGVTECVVEQVANHLDEVVGVAAHLSCGDSAGVDRDGL